MAADTAVRPLCANGATFLSSIAVRIDPCTTTFRIVDASAPRRLCRRSAHSNAACRYMLPGNRLNESVSVCHRRPNCATTASGIGIGEICARTPSDPSRIRPIDDIPAAAASHASSAMRTGVAAMSVFVSLQSTARWLGVGRMPTAKLRAATHSSSPAPCRCSRAADCADEMKVRRTLSTEEATEDCRRLESRRTFVGDHDRGEQSPTVHSEMDGVGDGNIDTRCRQVARVSDLVEIQGHRQGRQNIGGLLRIRVSRCTERLHERLAERMTQRRADSPKVRDQLATSE